MQPPPLSPHKGNFFISASIEGVINDVSTGDFIELIGIGINRHNGNLGRCNQPK